MREFRVFPLITIFAEDEVEAARVLFEIEDFRIARRSPFVWFGES